MPCPLLPAQQCRELNRIQRMQPFPYLPFTSASTLNSLQCHALPPPPSAVKYSELNRIQRMQPFSYLPFTRRLNWKKIRNLNLDKMVSWRGEQGGLRERVRRRQGGRKRGGAGE